MKKQLKSYGIITLGSVIFALAFDVFFAANQVAMGGITGLAQVINALAPVLSVGVLTFALNIPLFLAGWKFIGWHLLASSLFSMAVSSFAIDAIAALWRFPAMDPMLACLCGGAAMGLGFGMVFSQGATTGGTDMVARMVHKRFTFITVGAFLMMIDCVVVIAAGVFISATDALYALICIFISSKVLDMVLAGISGNKACFVISGAYERVTKRVMTEMNRGVTLLSARGAYTGQERPVVLCVASRVEVARIKDIVREEDENAFMFITEAHEALGEGFSSLSGEQ